MALQPGPVHEGGSVTLYTSDLQASDALQRQIMHLPVHLSETLHFGDDNQERQGRGQPEEQDEDEA